MVTLILFPIRNDLVRIPVVRIRVGQTSKGIRFAFNVLNCGRGAEVLLFHPRQRDQLEAIMEQLIAGCRFRRPRIVPSANQCPIEPAVTSRQRSPLLAVAYLSLEERRRNRSTPQLGGARQEDQPGCLTLPLPGVRTGLSGESLFDISGRSSVAELAARAFRSHGAQ